MAGENAGPAALRMGSTKEELPLQGGVNLQKPFKQASDTIGFVVRIFSRPLPPVSKTSQGPALLSSLEGIQGSDLSEPESSQWRREVCLGHKGTGLYLSPVSHSHRDMGKSLFPSVTHFSGIKIKKWN